MQDELAISDLDTSHDKPLSEFFLTTLSILPRSPMANRTDKLQIAEKLKAIDRPKHVGFLHLIR